MQPKYGNGPSVIETNPWLKDDCQRHLRILDVAERNSVIEGLPRFSGAMREQMLNRLAASTITPTWAWSEGRPTARPCRCDIESRPEQDQRPTVAPEQVN